MENFSQIESDILNKINGANDRNSYDKIKSEIFGKKELLLNCLKKLEV